MILQRYIGINMIQGWLLVMAVLGAVFFLIGFTQELERTNSEYTTLAAARYSLLILPNQLVSLAPVIALLGSIVALAGLDRHNELTVISCTGFPPGKLLQAITLPTLLLMGSLWICLEYVTPQLQQRAEQDRQLLREGDGGWIPGGVWSTDGKRYIHLLRMTEDNTPGFISLFSFDDTGQLQQALRADTAEVSEDRSWLFQDVREKVLEDGRLVTRNHRELDIPNLWSSSELPTLALNHDSMNLSILHQYSQYLASNGQPYDRFLNRFWQNLLMPLTVWAMVLLATPLSASVTAGRDRSYGVNIGIGAIVGILFYLGSQIIFSLGQLLNWSIPLVALLPTLVILTCALMLLRRMRW
ncbi:LPS export ABC transporter permease LptG [Candidatus Marimicrobium litorale]|jgi:lipopolysaccharide export system permease protein|uniref:LPS export ABC transporter permease LptG n=1 Tax=Candidatus Marimicrobium litorale TaxID=2518991 RepID=A0ABT3T6Q7_9GAMM|nr:LPS export ABC transporter permease LptG [Candidatus Marimicrobium litorale]MCX2977961.1 LPS export ABC transporter permease LptG [Candidatus Marimicrobium litorale]